MVVSVLLGAWNVLRGEWRCVYKEGGVVCVNGIGVARMPLLYADSWATLQQVCDLQQVTADYQQSHFILGCTWYHIRYVVLYHSSEMMSLVHVCLCEIC